MGMRMIQGLMETLQSGQVNLLLHLPPAAIVLAQQFKDTLGEDVQGAWDNFIESGQVWALLLGVVLGYIIRLLTSY